MGLRYQKRINIKDGLGLNLSQSGVSASYRTKIGSIGTRGFSLKTGIPGLSYRGKMGKELAIIFLAYILLMVAVLVIYNLMRLVVYILVWLYDSISAYLIRRKNKDIENSVS